MNAQTKPVVACIGLALTFIASASSARANLLVDPGYENNPLTTAFNVLNNFAAFQGQWGHEASTIVTGPNGGVTPPQGIRMLRMVNAGGVATQTFQVTDVTSYAALIDSGGATVIAGARFNAAQGVPAASAAVYVQSFSAANYGSQIGGITASGALILDSSPDTWQPIVAIGALPVGTRWLVTQVAYNNASIGSLAGYVDTARMVIVPEPAALVLFGLGGAVMLRRRSRQAV